MATSLRVKSRSGIGSFFLIAGAAFVVAGIVAMASGGMGGGIAGLTFLMIGGIWMLVALFLRGFYGRMARKADEERKLFETGKRATATVEGVETTGMVLNDVNQQIILRLMVRPHGEAEFPHERKMYVPFHGMPRTGDLIEVAYDPADRTKVALQTDWRSDTAGGRLLITRRPGETPSPAGQRSAAAPAATDDGATAPERVIDQLERLQRLREEGALTESEFAVQKARILSGQDV
jgi:hypothetical protein